MMDNTVKQLLELVKAAIVGVEPEFIFEVVYQRLYKAAAFHSIVGLIAEKAEKVENMSQVVRDALKKAQMLNIYREATQELTVQELLGDFENSGIDYMSLKGFIMKPISGVA